jgi:hypothetical protein
MEPSEKISQIEIELKAHEIQCEERWKTTFNRLTDIENVLERIESRILMAATTGLVFLAGVIVTILFRG